MVSGMLSNARIRELRPEREPAMDRFVDRIWAEAEASDGACGLGAQDCSVCGVLYTAHYVLR